MKISILMPAFNVERFIEKSIISVLEQEYNDFELIIVNDGSTDKTKDILKIYEQKDQRIRVLHQENKGLLMARRNAIKAAIGKYYMFLDSDDYLEKNALVVISENLKKSNPDLLLFNYNKVDEKSKFLETNNHIYSFKKENVLKISKEQVLIDFISKRDLNNIWTKVVKRNIISKDVTSYSKFGKLMQSEDRLQSLPIIYYSNEIVYIDYPLYNYRSNPRSITSNFKEKNLLDMIIVQNEIDYFLEINKLSKEIRELSYNYGVYYLSGAYLRFIRNKNEGGHQKNTVLDNIKQSKCINEGTGLKMKNKLLRRLIVKKKYWLLYLLSIINGKVNK